MIKVNSDSDSSQCNIEFKDDNSVWSQVKPSKDDNHLKERLNLFNNYQTHLFPKMMSFLEHNFNLILYGIGSKKNLLDTFQSKMLHDKHHFVIQGFMDPLNYRILVNSLKSILNVDSLDNISILKKKLQLNHHLYLLIHSLDIIYSSNKKIKTLIDTLLIKGNGKIHLVASVDQLHSGLLWTMKKTSQLNLTWLKCPTFESYVIERRYAKKFNSKNKSIHFFNKQLSIDAVINVYQNLTPNAQKIFILILNYYLKLHQNQSAKSKRRSQSQKKVNKIFEKDEKEKNDYHLQSYSFTQLYYDCLDEFLVNSESTLKTQLIEFIDHKLLKSVTYSDGKQYIELLIPVKLIPNLFEELKNRKNFCNCD